MFELIAFLMFLVFFAIMINSEEKNKSCELHKWIYDENGMICISCKKRPQL